MGVCASQGTFSSFYYFKHRDQYLFLIDKLKGGLPYNTDCFSYWQGTIQASYAVMRQLLLSLAFLPHYLYELRLLCLKKSP